MYSKYIFLIFLFNLEYNEFRMQFLLKRYLYKDIRYSYQSSNKVASGTPNESEIDFKRA